MNTAVVVPTVTTNAATLAAEQEARARRMVTFVNGFEVDDEEQYALAADELVNLKARTDAVEATRKAITVPLNTALDAANNLFRGPRSLYEQCTSILKTKMLAYRSKVEARQRAEQAERERQAEAERQRLAAESATLRQAGLDADADRAEQLSLVMVASPVATSLPTAKGTNVAKGLTFEVENKAVFCRWVIGQFGTRPDLLDYIGVDMVKLGAAVKAHGKTLNFEGIRVFEKSTIRVR